MRDAQAILLAVVSAPDVGRIDLWNFERPQADVAAELTDEIVAGGRRSATQLIAFVIGEPDGVLVTVGSGR